MKKFLCLFLLCLHLSSVAQENSNKGIVKATENLLVSLSPVQKSELLFDLSDQERYRWFFTPVPRKGLDYRKLNSEQKKLAMNILRESLSEQGTKTALAIMQLEAVLHVLEKHPADNDHRDPEKYYFSIFGTPANSQPWGWRIEGHHLSLNYTSENGKINSATPLFFGTNPARIPAGMPQPEGTEVLKKETEMGFSFLSSLSSEQKSKAKISEKSPYEIITSNKKTAEINQSEGLPFNDMNPEQRIAFIGMLQYYVRRSPDGFSRELMEKIENAGLENLKFVWMGGEQWGEGHYYRIHGPVIVVEYDCTQNNANHVHSVVRDLTNDWGAAGDKIAEHILNDH
jgi:hypothetical protein